MRVCVQGFQDAEVQGGMHVSGNTKTSASSIF